MKEELVKLVEHIVVPSDGIPRRLPQDKILYGDKLLGYVGTQKNAPVCLIIHGLPDSIKHRIKLVVAERDAETFGTDKLSEYERKVSAPPKSEAKDEPRRKRITRKRRA